MKELNIIQRMALIGYIITEKDNKLGNRMVIDSEGKEIGYMSANACWEFCKNIEKQNK